LKYHIERVLVHQAGKQHREWPRQALEIIDYGVIIGAQICV